MEKKNTQIEELEAKLKEKNEKEIEHLKLINEL